MKSIFFDLETSTAHTCGQILNYAFVLVDEQWRELSRCCGTLKLNPLELPRAGAILANRVDIKDHQQTAEFTEREGLQKIAEFIQESIAAEREPVALVGYNSFKFDTPYLRTSFIRNGLNPYFGKQVIERDLLTMVRWLSATNTEFPRLPGFGESAPEDRLSLRLETLTRHFGLLQGEQVHESLEDVRITVDLARVLCEQYDADVRRFDSYQVPTNFEQEGVILEMLSPQYELHPEKAELIASKKPMLHLAANRGGALWVDLYRFRDALAALEAQSESPDSSEHPPNPRWAVKWFSKKTGSFFLNPQAITNLSDNSELTELATQARKYFSEVSLATFFTRSECDIEQDIYRLDFDARKMLTNALWEGDRQAVDATKDRDARSLAIRAYLKEADWDDSADDASGPALPLGPLRKYSQYRYGEGVQGKRMLLTRSLPDEQQLMQNAAKENPREYFHPNFETLVAEVRETLVNAEARGKDDDVALLQSLLWWYYRAPVVAHGLGKATEENR